MEPQEEGNVPLRELSLRERIFIAVMEPQEEGNVPLRELPLRLR